ncbi:YfcL family protein [Bowmanella pacifica]|uniref:YfcL protein n=1 Tax=Bowmanella pacifica TaxID=502051 RepID=A0A917Z3R3_9ALTE|nr:YfcL family protein [Bowmanella pacifica]GGO73633.1 hypothetical protein GCM10010982_34610 [Bowmanella pacifica]
MSEQAFNQFVDTTENAFDQAVVQGSDHELFISSYLSGHFSLVVAKALTQANYCLANLDRAMQQSLSDAFANNELDPADQQQVLALWQQLLTQGR